MIDGFWIPSWLARKNPLQLLLVQRSVVRMLGADLRSAIRARVPLDVLRDTVQPFPSFSEIFGAALKALRRELAAPRRQTVA